MKKVLMAIIFAFLSITFVAGGVCLLQGCSQSTSKDSGGGISETPNQDEENSGGENDSDVEEDPDKETDSNALYFYLRVGAVVRTGSGESSYTVYSYGSSGVSNLFDVYWYDENGTAQTWGNAPTKDGSSTSVSKDATSATGCGTFSYQYDNTGFLGIGQVKRMGKVVRYSSPGSYGFIVEGAGTSSSFSNSDYAYYAQQDITRWHYGTSWSSSKPSASSVTTTTSDTTLYVYARKTYTYKFYLYRSSSGIGSATAVAGLSVDSSSVENLTFRAGYTLTGWSLTRFIDDDNSYYIGGSMAFYAGTVPAAYANQDREFYPVWTANTYTITYNSNYGTATTKTQFVTYKRSFTTKDSSIFVRTGYTIVGWSTSSSSTTGSYTRLSASYTYDNTTDITLYAQWEISTYTLTVVYYGGTLRQTNTTNLNVTASSCNPSSTTALTSGNNQKFTHTYSTTACTITFSRANTSYNYYISVNATPTTSSSLNSTTYSWTPTANVTITVYLYERYQISYNINNGIGTLPSTQYKVHGTDVTLRTNSLTRASYNATGWNTHSSGTGTAYASGAIYSENESLTLYADWTPVYATLTVKIMTLEDGTSWTNSSTGGTATIHYYDDNYNSIQEVSYPLTSGSVTVKPLTSRTVTISGTSNKGYLFVGVSSSETVPPYNNDSGSLTLSSNSTYIRYVFFIKDTNNKLKYDSVDQYYYFEDGYFPQSYVGDTLNSTLNNASSSSLTLDRNLKYMDANGETISIPLYTYSGDKYAKVTNNGVTKWFKVESIRWRVSEYGSSDTPENFAKYGYLYKNFKVVSDRVLWVGAVTREDTKESWEFNSSSMRTYFSEIYKNGEAAVSDEMPIYAKSNIEKSYYYGPVGQQEKVKYITSTYTGINIATEEEIRENLTDLRAKASDMVAFILGLDDDSYCDYWTRELGGSLKNAKMITRSGMTASAWLQNFYGVRFSLRMSEGNRI